MPSTSTLPPNDTAASREAFLLQQLQQNPSRGFHLVFREYYSSLYYFANYLINNKQDAEDIVSNVFTKLWHRLSAEKKLESIKPFLVVATRNACFDYLKHNKVKVKAHNEILHTASRSEAAIEAYLFKAEIMQKAVHAIDKMPTRMRRIFKLAFGEDALSSEEIAAMLNIAESTVRVQKAKAIKMLQEALKKGKLE